MKSVEGNLLVVIALVAAVSGCSSTRNDIAPPAPEKPPVGNAFLPLGSRTLEPFSHVLFCKRYPDECAGTGGPEAIELAEPKRAELAEVNRDVNGEIRPLNDSGGDDVWTLSPRAGDCEDYAVTKRQRLIAQGWPASTLRLAIGFTRKGEGHLVLVVRTTRGDLVLDNETDAIRGWRDAGLNWRSVQSASNPRVWYEIGPSRPAAV